ncbi:PKD domain-containing protein, partial [Sphaerochaeta sp.]|uniref:PKD domain-containing protein n=1 Tax=Sphaerochaeta sp. TaxID=1972642 RepID=UPI003D11C52B
SLHVTEPLGDLEVQITASRKEGSTSQARQVSSVEVSLIRTDRPDFVQKQTLSAQQLLARFAQLPVGTWELRVVAKDSEGRVLSYLGLDEERGARSLFCDVERGKTEVVEASLVPSVEGRATLDLHLDWDTINPLLLGAQQEIRIHLATVYTADGLDDEIGVSPSATIGTRSAQSLSLTLSDGEECTLSNLPSGVYEVKAELWTTDQNQAWVRISGMTRFARLWEGEHTDMQCWFFNEDIEVGSGGFDLDQDLAPLLVSFMPEPPSQVQYPNSTGYGSTVQATFSVQAEGSRLTYVWYVNGEEVEGETQASATLVFAESGQYTVMASVSELDAQGDLLNWGSAQTEVDVYVLQEERP